MKLTDSKINLNKILICFLLLTSYFSLLTSLASAEDFAIISADQMEYLYQSNTYIARGSVTITFGESMLYADEILLDSKTYDAVAIGNVTYMDPDANISAERIELNLKTKLGTIYESNVFYKNHNFRIRSGEISKTGEKSFSLDKADVTTCDALL
ncbi:MAG: LPS-assembly protein LptD [Nitrospirae bacterium]|nr:LPS-assembly protein LptD [Nitrospirota bacterium]